jgi:glutamate formiminotransferase / formiminotetrahydrofolate cyclodeaminase
MHQMVGCIATFSAGESDDIVTALVAAWVNSGVRVVDVCGSADGQAVDLHCAGDLPSVERGAIVAVANAAESIDMGTYPGADVRLGATDRLTFVPLLDVDLEACAELARRVGRQVALEVGLPVFLFGGAAARPDRRAAEDVAAGGFNALALAIEGDAQHAPDCGPRHVGPAGAVAVGAAPLALHLTLRVSGSTSVQDIARALDARSGGLADVEAAIPSAPAGEPSSIALRVADVRRTPLVRVVELARSEAEQRGARVTTCALHGLVPRAALVDAAASYLRLEPLGAEQLLEDILTAAPEAEAGPALGVRHFVDSVAADDPTPGGGTVAALVGALGAALTGMVAGLTLGRPRYAPVEASMQRVRRDAGALQQALMELMGADREAFDAVMLAYRLPRATAEETERRRDAIQAALRRATQVPIATMQRAVEVMRLARDAAAAGNLNAVSDAGVAAYLAQAAALSAALNVTINIMGLRDLEEGDGYRRASNELLLEARTLGEEVQRLVHERIKG